MHIGYVQFSNNSIFWPPKFRVTRGWLYIEVSYVPDSWGRVDLYILLDYTELLPACQRYIPCATRPVLVNGYSRDGWVQTWNAVKNINTLFENALPGSAFTFVRRHLYPANPSPEWVVPGLADPAFTVIVRRHLYPASPLQKRTLPGIGAPKFAVCKDANFGRLISWSASQDQDRCCKTRVHYWIFPSVPSRLGAEEKLSRRMVIGSQFSRSDRTSLVHKKITHIITYIDIHYCLLQLQKLHYKCNDILYLFHISYKDPIYSQSRISIWSIEIIK